MNVKHSEQFHEQSNSQWEQYKCATVQIYPIMTRSAGYSLHVHVCVGRILVDVL